MVSRDEVINYVITSELLKNAIVNICPPQWRDDFESHIFLQVLEMNPNKLIKAYNKGYIDWLLVRIMTNQLKTSSSFWKLYRNNGSYSVRTLYREELPKTLNWLSGEMGYGNPGDETVTFLDTEEGVYDDTLDIQREIIDKLLNHTQPYHRVLFQLHLDGLTYRQIEKRTGVKYHTLRVIILKVKDQFKEIIKNDLH